MSTWTPKNNAIPWTTFWDYHCDLDIVDVALYEYVMFLSKGAGTPFVNLSLRNIAIQTRCSKCSLDQRMKKFIALGIIKALEPVSPRKTTSYQVMLEGILKNLEHIYKTDQMKELRKEYLVEYLISTIPVYYSPVTFDKTPRIRNGKFNIITK